MSTYDDDRHDESGVTLIELVISVMILGIVIAAIFGAMTALTNTDRRAHERVASQENIRTALTQMARDLRSAQRLDVPSSTSAAATSVSFIAVNGDHLRLRLDAPAKVVYREREQPFGSGTWVTTAVYRNIRNGDDNTALLRYYGAGNQRLESSATLTDLAVCTLRVRLTLKAAPADVPSPYSAAIDVGLRNRGSRGVTGC